MSVMNKVTVINIRYQSCIILLKYVHNQLRNHTEIAAGFDDVVHIQVVICYKNVHICICKEAEIA
jgi:hypothetical protein